MKCSAHNFHFRFALKKFVRLLTFNGTMAVVYVPYTHGKLH